LSNVESKGDSTGLASEPPEVLHSKAPVVVIGPRPVQYPRHGEHVGSIVFKNDNY